MAADGSVIIEVNLNTSEAEKALGKLKEKISDAEKIVNDGPKDDGLAKALDTAKEKAGEVEKVIQKMNVEFGRGVSKEVLGFVENYANGMDEASQEANEMRQALENAETAVKTLESQGKWFGDQDYDEAVKNLERITADIKLYKKELVISPKQENPFGLDTYPGKIKEAEIALKRLEAAGKGLGDNGEYDKAFQNLARLKNEAKQYAAELTKTTAQREREAAALEKATRKAQEAAAKEAAAAAESARLREIKENAAVSDQGIADLNRELSELKARLGDLKSAGVGVGYEEYDNISARIKEIRAELKKYEAGIGKASVETEKGTQRMSRAMEEMEKRTAKVSSRLKEILRSALVFTVISQALSKFRDWMGKVILTNNEATAAIAKLKGALLTLAQPLVEIIIPAFVTLVNILTRIVSAIASVIARLFGKTAQQSADAAKNLYEEQNALTGVSKAAKKAAGSLASFDEINTINTEDSSSGGGGVAENISPDFSSVISGELDKITALVGGALLALGAILTFSGVNVPLGLTLMALGAVTLASVIAENWDSIVESLQGPLGLIATLLGGALFAVGAILAFSGANVPLGIALMAIGAAGLAAAVYANWNSIANLLQGPLGILIGILSAALLVIGAILTFSGANIPLGIGLMIAGAIGLAAAVGVNWDSLSQVLQGPIGILVAVLSGALLVIGAILTFSGANIPLGIGLMVVGAIGLAAVVAANWDSISNMLGGPIKAVLTILSGAALVIGAILLFSGANIPLGIGLMMAGAVGLGVVATINWEAVTEALQGPLGGIVALVSGALLAIGAVLLFSGANIPLGLGLLIVGAAGLAATFTANWDTIEKALQGPVGITTTVISGALLVLGAILTFSGAALPLGIGLLAAGAVGLATTIAANWNTIEEMLKGPIGTVTAIVSAALLVLGAILAFSGAALPLGLGLMVVGAVGLAATIAANWNTITDALGGTIATITTIVSAALLVLGVILMFTGAGIPLGLGMVLIGVAGLAATVAPKWDFILTKLKEAWDNVKIWWNSNVSKFLSSEYWSDLGQDMLNGFWDGLESIWRDIESWALGVVRWFKELFGGASDSVSNLERSGSSFGGGRSGGGGFGSSSRFYSMPRVESMPAISRAEIPALAAGAVIPPNREFLAVLGDQRRGNNLEGPESLFRQIVREESGSGEIAPLLESILSAIRDGHIIMVDGTVFGRTAIKTINRVNAASGRQNLIL